MEEGPDCRGAPPTRVFGAARLAALPRDPDRLPPLPGAYQEALDRGLSILGLTLPPGARRSIDAHVRLLLAWNRAVNLTAITDPAAVATRHVLDSLTVVPFIEATPATVLDLGSGGGFPGLPLGAALLTSRVTLLDSVAKKAAFLDAAADAAGLGARVGVRLGRAEDQSGQEWDVVVVRGVGSLADLAELALPLVRIGGRLIAWKRGDLTGELEAARRAAPVLGATEPTIRSVPNVPGLGGHVLVEIGKAVPTPPGYPRDPGARKRRPW